MARNRLEVYGAALVLTIFLIALGVFTFRGERLDRALAGDRRLRTLQSSRATFAIMADVQRTIPFFETTLLGREQNDAERVCLMNALGRENIGFLALLGDLVARSNSGNWDYFLRLIAPLTSAKVPVLPALGNHEYMGDSALAATHFPQLADSGWYSWIHRGVLLIWLNSNLSELTVNQRTQQWNWYAWAVDQAEQRDDVRGVVVMAHHPFYSNSKLTGDRPEVEAEFGQPFFSGRKTMAYVSGHSHTYERLPKSGKLFVVTGGGGGPRVELEARHEDLVRGAAPRPFHYILATPNARGIAFQTKGLNKGECDVRVLESWFLPWPGR